MLGSIAQTLPSKLLSASQNCCTHIPMINSKARRGTYFDQQQSYQKGKLWQRLTQKSDEVLITIP